MNVVPRPHVSDAIRQLRGWVTLAATILGVCCGTQMLVFGFAAYTNVRWEEAKPTAMEKTLRVVGAGPKAKGSEGSGQASPAPENPPAAVAEGNKALDPTKSVEQATTSIRATVAPIGNAETARAPEMNRLKSPADLLLRRASGLGSSIGVMAVVCLFALTILGAVVAGGGGVPGVERAVTSAVWSMILCMLCLPWGRALPGLGVQGVFSPYADMIWAIDTRALGIGASFPVALIMQWVAAPLCGMIAAMGVAIWFRAGVERGVIVMSPNDLDRAVVREAEMIQKRGVAISAPKAVGALHQAIGSQGSASGGASEGPRGAPAGTLTAVERVLREKEMAGAGAGGGGRTVARGKLSGGVADEDFRRPI